MFGLYHYIAIAMFAGFCGLDLVVRARIFPEVARWKTKGIAFMALNLGLATYAPLLWDASLGAYQIVDGSVLPFWAQIMCGFLVLEFGIYIWHRTMHNVPGLWRWLHQMHHSAERVDIWGAFYFHPFDMIGWALIGSLALVLGIGLSAEAAVVVALMASFCSMFQHSNLSTPRWLGYLVTRPESHSVHHQRDVHAYNYGDIPLFDMLFGTFRNPRRWEGEVGFFDGSSSKLGAMMIGRKIA